MTHLADFLLARIAEREAKARRAMNGFPTGEWTNDGGIYAGHPMHEVVDHAYGDTAEHIALNDPTLVLAECEAKRAIVETRQLVDAHIRQVALARPEEARDARNTRTGLDVAIAALALPYADHPDYRQEWRP